MIVKDDYMEKRPEYDLKRTGEQIRRLRKERNISVDQIRQYMRFGSSQAIYKWEKGQCFPQADNLLALAKLFGVNPTEIMVEKSVHIDSRIAEMLRCFMKLKAEKTYRRDVIEYLIEI